MLGDLILQQSTIWVPRHGIAGITPAGNSQRYFSDSSCSYIEHCSRAPQHLVVTFAGVLTGRMCAVELPAAVS